MGERAGEEEQCDQEHIESLSHIHGMDLSRDFTGYLSVLITTIKKKKFFQVESKPHL